MVFVDIDATGFRYWRAGLKNHIRDHFGCLVV